jgi:WD40 repeat protein
LRRPLGQGSFLATCGSNRIVNVFNRQGEEHAEIPLDGSGQCTGLEWDKDGEMLAVMQEKSSVIKLWDANQNAESSLDTGLKEELSLIRWSASGTQLAIGTAKGECARWLCQELSWHELAIGIAKGQAWPGLTIVRSRLRPRQGCACHACHCHR